MSAVAEVVCLLEKINLNKNEFLKDELIKASMKDFEDFALKVAELSNSNHVTLESLSDLIKKESKKVLSSILEKSIENISKNESLKSKCPCCNKELKIKQRRPRKLETMHGEISILRGYFHCFKCKVGFSPLDEKLELTSERKQSDMQKAALLLAKEMPYETASSVFGDVTGVVYSDHAMHELVDKIGAEIRIEDVLPKAEEIQKIIDENTNNGQWKPVLVISADGAHLPTRPEGYEGRDDKRGAGEWREAKGFRLYLSGLNERIVQICSFHQICNEEEFGKALNVASKLFDQNSVRIAAVADGAGWIWKHIRQCFPKAQEILDYYHCKEHVYEVGEHHFKDDEVKQSEWIESTMAKLFFGEVKSVIWGLDRMKAHNALDAEKLRKLVTIQLGGRSRYRLIFI